VISVSPPGAVARRVATNIRIAQATGRPRITQAQLAAAAGISEAAMSNRLRELVPLDADDIAACARLLGVTVAALFDESDPPASVGHA